MFGIRRRPKHRDPAVLEAEAKRDRLRKEADEAIEQVDQLKDDIIDQYRRANGLRRGED